MATKKPSLPLPPRKNGHSKRRRAAEPVHKRAIKAAAKGIQESTDEVPSTMDHINKELYKRNSELAIRNKTLALLRNLDQISLSTTTINDMAKQMSLAIATELGYDMVSIAIVNPDKKELQWLAVSSPIFWIESALNKINPEDIVMPLNEHINSMAVIKDGKQDFVDDLHQVFPPFLIGRLMEANQNQDEEPIEHSILFPLRFSEQTLGLLSLSSSRELKSVSSFEQEAVSGIIGLVALALYKAKIYEDLQRTTSALGEANKQLQELDKAKSEFLSIASHQLYTPLTALRGYLSMLKEGDFGAMTPEQTPIIAILNTSAERLIRLIRDLLDISRIESGRFELSLQQLDLAVMTKDLVDNLLPNAIAKGLQLTFEPPAAGLAQIVGDEQRLRQVMLNFIDNSIKYTPKGWIKVTLTQDQDFVTFAVSDSGKGIAPDEIPKLFHKFSRVGGASRFHTEGTGLGLYVAKQIVKEHHGDVLITSPGVGKGSTFSMKLPAIGTGNSLKVGEKATVIIKAADAQGESEENNEETKKEEPKEEPKQESKIETKPAEPKVETPVPQPTAPVIPPTPEIKLEPTPTPPPLQPAPIPAPPPTPVPAIPPPPPVTPPAPTVEPPKPQPVTPALQPPPPEKPVVLPLPPIKPTPPPKV